MPLTEAAPPAQAFWFVRHGESEANAAGVIAGRCDSPLTARGREQAAAMAARLAAHRVTRILSSPQQRALDTALALAHATGAPVTLVDALRERSFGRLEGQPVDAVGDHFSLRPPGGETWPQFAARVRQALAHELADPRGSATAVVAHAGVHRALLEWYAGRRVNERPPNALAIRVDASVDADRWRPA